MYEKSTVRSVPCIQHTYTIVYHYLCMRVLYNWRLFVRSLAFVACVLSNRLARQPHRSLAAAWRAHIHIAIQFHVISQRVYMVLRPVWARISLNRGIQIHRFIRILKHVSSEQRQKQLSRQYSFGIVNFNYCNSVQNKKSLRASTEAMHNQLHMHQQSECVQKIPAAAPITNILHTGKPNYKRQSNLWMNHSIRNAGVNLIYVHFCLFVRSVHMWAANTQYLDLLIHSSSIIITFDAHTNRTHNRRAISTSINIGVYKK